MNKQLCEDCPLRLYNKKGYCLEGVGDIPTDSLIVVPNVDYIAYKNSDFAFSKQVELINHTLFYRGVDYPIKIVPYIRCNIKLSKGMIDATNPIINKLCLKHLNSDIIDNKIKNVMLCGDVAKSLLNIPNITNTFNIRYMNNNQITFYTNFSPLIIYNDEEKYKVFKDNLVNWINAIKFNMFDNYKLVRI